MNRPFPDTELDARRDDLRARLADEGLDGLIVAVPENIYYLTGLDHWGYFACHLLIVPQDGDMILIARAMEGVTIANQVSNAVFRGHADHEEIADHVIEVLVEAGLNRGRLGLELRSLFLTPRIADSIRDGAPACDWSDGSGIIDAMRLVKSPLEMEYTRLAAAAADAGTLAAIEAIRDGATDHEVAAACHSGMILAGSEYPGFGPFIRPTSRLGEEHTTWRGDRFVRGDAVFLELAGSFRRYQAPMGRLVYIGDAPEGAEASADIAIRGMEAICEALRPGALAGEVYAAWHDVAASAGLDDYHRHHCGYLVSIGFPPSWTGGSRVTGLAPDSKLPLRVGMTFHAHSWFTTTRIADYFISNTVLLTETGAEVLTKRTPETLILR